MSYYEPHQEPPPHFSRGAFVGILLTGVAITTLLVLLIAGCSAPPSSPVGRSDGPTPVVTSPDAYDAILRPRRATAVELNDAAQTGTVPPWFSKEERDAVERIRR